MTTWVARPESGKELNRRLILDQIRRNAQISRSDLVRLTGLSKATVSSIVAELMEAGLVEEVGNQNPPVGRPRILLSLVANANFTLGAELTDEECRVVLTNLHAEPIRRVYRAVGSNDLSPDRLIPVLEACVAEAIQGVDPACILALGVCVPGIVDPSSGTVTLSVMLPWRDVPLGVELNSRFPFPVAVFSRGTAATWGERWYGVGKDVSNLLYVRVGSGIVAGLVINGQPYLGRNFGAGELGHFTVQPDGALCRCGNRGCLATVATTGVLLSRVRQLLREMPDAAMSRVMQENFDHLKLEDVVAAAKAGAPAALQAFAEVGRWLGIALGSTVNLLNLDMVVIGGPMALAGDYLLQPLRQELHQRALPTHLAQMSLVASMLKEDAPAVGAASLVLHELFSPVRTSAGMLPADRVSLFA